MKARSLRANQTNAEQRLWFFLRARQLNGLKFRRQHPIGPYIVDFCCVEHRLVIELDGGQHADNTRADERRTQLLNAKGYRTLRFWNHEVLAETTTVIDAIVMALSNVPPHRHLSPEAGERTRESRRREIG